MIATSFRLGQTSLPPIDIRSPCGRRDQKVAARMQRRSALKPRNRLPRGGARPENPLDNRPVGHPPALARNSPARKRLN